MVFPLLSRSLAKVQVSAPRKTSAQKDDPLKHEKVGFIALGGKPGLGYNQWRQSTAATTKPRETIDSLSLRAEIQISLPSTPKKQ